MGRKKIQISRITDERNRQVLQVYIKRKPNFIKRKRKLNKLRRQIFFIFGAFISFDVFYKFF